MPFQSAAQRGAATPQFKDTVKFIVTNQLQVFENSSIKSLEIMSKERISLEDMHTESIEASEDDLRKMCGLLLQNSKDILTTCFQHHCPIAKGYHKGGRQNHGAQQDVPVAHAVPGGARFAGGEGED